MSGPSREPQKWAATMHKENGVGEAGGDGLGEPSRERPGRLRTTVSRVCPSVTHMGLYRGRGGTGSTGDPAMTILLGPLILIPGPGASLRI